ncbi:hypothetical protein CVT25_008670 [Psilocybe cyanescens]|uniref:Uncharacterized protein n=1 Tax=Psilocybe cyanescens TaxID=93625 RepID=A0A409XLE0_PSICY|nr:hypothetical protein CVT25_008670 [Psilocybe cyanescens]
MASAHHSSWIPLTREDSGHNLWRHASSSILVHSHSSASKKKVADQFTESPMSPRITSLGVPGSASSTGASRHGKSPHSSSTHQDKDSYMDMEMDIAEKTTGELSCSPADQALWGVGVGTSTGAGAAGGFGDVGARDGETSDNDDVDDDNDGDEIEHDLNSTSYLEHGAHPRACARAPCAPSHS